MRHFWDGNAICIVDDDFINLQESDAEFHDKGSLTERYITRNIDAVDELLEVAGLRGDNELPHPEDDPKLWTARMQEAWDTLVELREGKTTTESEDNG